MPHQRLEPAWLFAAGHAVDCLHGGRTVRSWDGAVRARTSGALWAAVESNRESGGVVVETPAGPLVDVAEHLVQQ